MAKIHDLLKEMGLDTEDILGKLVATGGNTVDPNKGPGHPGSNNHSKKASKVRRKMAQRSRKINRRFQ